MPAAAGESLQVEMEKEGGVLGVRIAGGSDKPYGGGFIRIKQLTAETAASRSRRLQEGDIIVQVCIYIELRTLRVHSLPAVSLQVDGVSLAGMTHCQAAETVLQAGQCVSLLLHRPSDPHWWRGSSSQPLTPLPEESRDTPPPTQAPSAPPESPPPPSPSLPSSPIPTFSGTPPESSPPLQDYSPVGEEVSESEESSGPAYQLPEESSGPTYQLSEESSGPAYQLPEESSGPTYQLSEESSGPAYQLSEESSGPAYQLPEESSGPSYQLPEESSFLDSFHSSSEPHLAELLAEVSISDSRSEPNLLSVPGEGTREEVFDVTLRKGYRGFGFRLDKNKSGRKGYFMLGPDKSLDHVSCVYNYDYAL